MNNLCYVLEKLKKRKSSNDKGFFIPEVWNAFGFSDFLRCSDRQGEIKINPYDFMANCIGEHILPQAQIDKNYLESILKSSTKDSCADKVIYSMLPRMFTCWRHYESKEVYSPGTLLKAICLLPYLRNMGVDIIYLLPVFESSTKYKKGEIGSPYSVKNFFKLDPALHDELLGTYDEKLLNIEFKAFVEACHILGIGVLIDFVFRTAARDSDLIIDYPEWFYWVDLKYRNFSTPYVHKEKEFTVINAETLKSLYTCNGIDEYLSVFSQSPKCLDTEKWEKVKKRSLDTGENILELIEKNFNITTAPGFSDIINDMQPPWTDITFLRYYFDINPEVKEYITNENQPPFILQDGVCLNFYFGDNINNELCDIIEDLIPFYQTNFGIDGARVDAAHVLPDFLNKNILKKIKDENGNFILWAEDLSEHNTGNLRENGYDFVTGGLWSLYPKIGTKSSVKEILSNVFKYEILALGALEIPDSPRASYIYNSKIILESILIFNAFMPNTVFFINDGMELGEIQPMNLGLESTEDSRFILDSGHPFYGKLAFFDNYCLQWVDEKSNSMLNTIKKTVALRKRFADIISKKGNFLDCSIDFSNDSLYTLLYYDYVSSKGVFIFINQHHDSLELNFLQYLPSNLSDRKFRFTFAYYKGELCDSEWDISRSRVLCSGEILVCSIHQIV